MSSQHSRFMRIVCAEWRPSDHTLIHDRAQTPPVATEGVALPTKDLGRDVIGCADSRVCHDSPRFPPVVDLASIADRQIDLVECNAMPIILLGRGRSPKQLLIVRCFVLLVEASREAKVGEFQMAVLVEEDIVGLDISMISSVNRAIESSWSTHRWMKPSL